MPAWTGEGSGTRRRSCRAPFTVTKAISERAATGSAISDPPAGWDGDGEVGIAVAGGIARSLAGGLDPVGMQRPELKPAARADRCDLRIPRPGEIRDRGDLEGRTRLRRRARHDAPGRSGSPAGRPISASPPVSAPASVAARSAGRPARRSRRGLRRANTASLPAGTVTVATATGFGSVLTAIGWRSRIVRTAAASLPSGVRVRPVR